MPHGYREVYIQTHTTHTHPHFRFELEHACTAGNQTEIRVAIQSTNWQLTKTKLRDVQPDAVRVAIPRVAVADPRREQRPVLPLLVGRCQHW